MDNKINQGLATMFQNALEAKRIKEYKKAYIIYTDIITINDFLFKANLITEKWYKDIFAVATTAKQDLSEMFYSAEFDSAENKTIKYMEHELNYYRNHESYNIQQNQHIFMNISTVIDFADYIGMINEQQARTYRNEALGIMLDFAKVHSRVHHLNNGGTKVGETKPDD